MTRMPIRIAPRTQAVEAEGGAACGVRGRAASAGRSLPAPGRLARDAPGRDWPGRVADERAAPARPPDRAEDGRPVDVPLVDAAVTAPDEAGGLAGGFEPDFGAGFGLGFELGVGRAAAGRAPPPGRPVDD